MDSQAGPLAEALARSGIPFQKRSHDRLADDPAVEMVLAALREGEDGDASEVLVRTGEILKRLYADKINEQADNPPALDLDAALELLLSLARPGADLREFLSTVAMSSGADLWDPRADRVSLLTLHAAKGLEFRVVFIAGCEDGFIPLRFGEQLSPAQEAEERRLLFVGMTRAREHLILTYATKRLLHGRLVSRELSPFVHTIAEELLARVKTRAGQRSRAKTTPQLKLF
jgi:DNA helicase-2/ATP-dependent DNA helicase PcrA